MTTQNVSTAAALACLTYEQMRSPDLDGEGGELSWNIIAAG